MADARDYTRFLGTGHRDERRDNAAAANYFTTVPKTEREELSANEYTKLKIKAEQGLETKFSLMKIASTDTSDQESLKNIYNVTIRIGEFQRALRQFDMENCFLLPSDLELDPDTNEYWPSPGARMVNLFTSYSDTSLDVVKQASEFYTRRAPDYTVQNLLWSGAKLLDSCTDELRQKIEEVAMAFPIEHSTGPVYFKIMMGLVLASTSASLRTVSRQVERLSLKDFPGENVVTACSFLRGAIEQLKNGSALPSDIIDLIAETFKKATTKEFATYIATLHTLHEVGNPRLSVESLLSKAEEKYTAMVASDKWTKGTSDTDHGSVFYAAPTLCFNCGSKEHMVRDCPKPRDEDTIKKNATARRNMMRGRGGGRSGRGGRGGRFGRGGRNAGRGNERNEKHKDPFRIPPKGDEARSKTLNNKEVHWCGRCSLWTSHDTAKHQQIDQLGKDTDKENPKSVVPDREPRGEANSSENPTPFAGLSHHF